MACQMHAKRGTRVPRARALSVGLGPEVEQESPRADLEPGGRSSSAAQGVLAKIQVPSALAAPLSHSVPDRRPRGMKRSTETRQSLRELQSKDGG